MTEAKSVLQRHPTFKELKDTRIQQLAQSSRWRVFQKNQDLFLAGSEARHILLVISGLVKITRYRHDGIETILGIFGPKDLVGLVAALKQQPYPATGRALTKEVRVLLLRSREVLAIMAEDPGFTAALNGALMCLSRVLQDKIDVMSARAVPQRLASLLLTLAERFGEEQPGGSIEVSVALTRGEMASLIGSRFETVSRILSGWQRMGLVRDVDDGFYLSAPEALIHIQQEGPPPPG
jgi:CRP-like cAMP-binding protein